MDLIMTIKKVLETVIAASGFDGGEGKMVYVDEF